MTEEKFCEVYRRYYKLVKKTVYSILRDVDFSEDVCQEVFIMFAEKSEFLEEEYYKQWLLVNAKRKAIDFCRKAYQVHEVTAVRTEEEDELEGDTVWASCKGYRENEFEEEITHRIALQELTGKFFEDLAKKNSDWYEIVMRMTVEGESAKETARALGISMGNLRVKRHRIKAWTEKYYRTKYEQI